MANEEIKDLNEEEIIPEIKRVTLHPVDVEGYPDLSVNLYPKILVDGIVDRQGKQVEIQEKLVAGENITIEGTTISAVVETVDAYTKEESDEKFATKEELVNINWGSTTTQETITTMKGSDSSGVLQSSGYSFSEIQIAASNFIDSTGTTAIILNSGTRWELDLTKDTNINIFSLITMYNSYILQIGDLTIAPRQAASATLNIVSTSDISVYIIGQEDYFGNQVAMIVNGHTDGDISIENFVIDHVYFEAKGTCESIIPAEGIQIHVLGRAID